MLPQSPSSNIEQTYCIPLRDTRLGFKSHNIHVRSDRENIIVTLFKHPKIIKLEQELQNIRSQRLFNRQQSTQTNVQAVLQKFIFEAQIKEYNQQQLNNQTVNSQYTERKISGDYSEQCNTLTQTLLTGKIMDSFQQSTNQYLRTLESRLHQFQNQSPFKKKKMFKMELSPKHYSPTVSHFDLVHTEIQTEQNQAACLELFNLNEQLLQMKSTLQKIFADNLALIQIKTDSDNIIKNQANQITDLHSEISKLTLENSRMKNHDMILSRKISEEPVRQKMSLNSSRKNLLGQVKVKQLETLQQQNRVLRHYIEAMKSSDSPIKLMKKQSVKLEQDPLLQQKDHQIVSLKLELSKLQQQRNTLRIQNDISVVKLKSIEQKIQTNALQNQKKQHQNQLQIKNLQTSVIHLNQQLQISSKDQSNLTQLSLKNNNNLKLQNKQLQQKILTLRKQFQTQKQSYSLLTNQNLNSIITKSLHQTHFSPQYSQLNYKKLSQLYEQKCDEMKKSQVMVKNLKQIVLEYQQIIDERQQSIANDELLLVQERVNHYTNIINEKLEHLEDYFTCGPMTERQQQTSVCFDKILFEYKKERSKRILADNKLDRLSKTLIEYEQEIMEKTAKISDLNFIILQLEQRSMSYSQDYPSVQQSRFKYQYKPANTYRTSQYDRTPIQHASEQQTITQSNVQQDLQQTYSEMKVSKTSRTSRTQHETLKCLLGRKILDKKQKITMIKKIIGALENNKAAWNHEITLQNIIIKSKSIIIDTNHTNIDPMYASPEQLYKTKSQTSCVWRVSIIIDYIIHNSPFFNNIQSIVDPKFLYRFRSKDSDYQCIRKLLLKSLIKNNLNRINMPEFINTFRFGE